jgi:hypothetical protein
MAKKSAAKVTQADIKKAARRVRVHFHALPRCAGRKHDRSCKGKPKEVSCVRMKRGAVGFCACTHF